MFPWKNPPFASHLRDDGCMPGEPRSVSAPAGRVLSIDVLRGLTIALMILVNDPGDWAHTYTQLDHAKWNGFTLTDFVFPNFLFLVGVSIILSLSSRVARGDSRRVMAGHIARRALVIFVIKMMITAFPHFHYTHFRLFGVLTRIALCYLAAALICLVTQRARTLLAITAVLLVGYWGLMRFVPVPGLGMPVRDLPLLDPDANLAAWLDRAFSSFTLRTIHTGVLYEHTRDPEGLLSTLPAIATTLLGCVTGLWLRFPKDCGKNHRKGEEEHNVLEDVLDLDILHHISTVTGLLIFGFIALAGGILWNLSFPINKNLWTSSYVLFVAGLSLLVLALCYWLIDMRHLDRSRWGKLLLWPWLVFGSNAITAFVFSNFLVELLIWIKVPNSFTGKSISVLGWIYQHLFARNGSTNVTSLAFAVCFVLVCFLPNWVLWRRRIFLKV